LKTTHEQLQLDYNSSLKDAVSSPRQPEAYLHYSGPGKIKIGGKMG